MVVALIALLVALGGTSIAAVTALPNNSVGTPQLKHNAVTSGKIGPGQVKPSDLSASAKTSGPQGPAGPAGPAGVASPGYVAQVFSQTSNSSSSTSSTSFVDLSGGTQAITVPTGETSRLYAWFNAQSLCTGGAGTFCSVRITVDGNEMAPASSSFRFDTPGDPAEAHSIVRVSDTLAAGSHTVKVQSRTSSGATSLTLDNWALVVQATKVT
jgi:hypothetical protein